MPLLGRVTAGPGGIAEEHVEGWRHIEATFIPHGQEADCFLLEARGESMIEAGISDGAQLLVCVSVAVHDGDIAVVDVDGEAVVKRAFIDPAKGTVTLVSANPAFRPVTVPRARIIGRVMAATNRL